MKHTQEPYREPAFANAARIVACAGIEDPAAELARLRRVEVRARALVDRYDLHKDEIEALRSALEG